MTTGLSSVVTRLIVGLAQMSQDIKYNPTIIAMFLSYVRVFVRVLIVRKKDEVEIISRPFLATKNKLPNNREAFRLV